MTHVLEVALSDPQTIGVTLAATPGNCTKVKTFFADPKNKSFIDILNKDPSRLMLVKNELLATLEETVDGCTEDPTSRKAVHNLKQVLASPGKYGPSGSIWGTILLLLIAAGIATAAGLIGARVARRRTLLLSSASST